MSDLVILGAGSIVFIISTWATIVFGLRRMHDLQHRDLEQSPEFIAIQDEGLTELYVTQPTRSGPTMTV